MPIKSKGPRLYLRRATSKERATWVIRDGSKSVRTGFGAIERGEAEKRLAAYIIEITDQAMKGISFETEALEAAGVIFVAENGGGRA